MDLKSLAIWISVIGSVTVAALLVLLAGIVFWGFSPMSTAIIAVVVTLVGILSTYFLVRRNSSN